MGAETGDRLVTRDQAAVYALLADGTTIEIRTATPDDRITVLAMHEAMSPENEYRRFFSLSKLSAEREAERVCRAPAPDHAALLALRSGELVGVGSYEIASAGNAAEIALAVPDDMHGRGVGTLLLEHLVSAASRQGVSFFTSPVLAENAEMLKVFADAGLRARRQIEAGVIEFTCDLPQGDTDPFWETYQEAVARREGRADVASLRHVFQPDSVAVVGAGRRIGTIGRAILHNIVAGGYQGQVYAINPRASHMEGVPCLPSVATLPGPVDLAVIAVPPAAVPAVADECGRRGVKAMVVITAGLDALQGADLLATCRRYGMRLIGPHCFGVAVPEIGLDATFAARHPATGTVGLVTQSGGLGLTLLDRLSRLGLGISSFASVGNKYDISSNDLLMWWERDDTTRLAVLYIESFGNPRKFARTVRRVGRKMPVLALQGGRSAAGPQSAAFHGTAGMPPVTREALFEQAGIIATESLAELLDAAALLASQPLPAGRQVAVVSNVGGAGVLAADACTEYGLVVPKLGADTRRRLHALVPPGGAVDGPVDTTAAVAEIPFRRCLELVAADEAADAVIALVLPTAATGDLIAAVRAADVSVPLVAVALDQTEGVRLLSRAADGTAGRPGSIPLYADPEAAAHALARAATYAAWRARPSGHIRELSDVATGDARGLVRAFLDRSPQGGWLPPDKVADLLDCYGIPLAARTPGTGHDDTATEGEATEGKATEGNGETGGSGGIEVVVGVAQEPVFGPLVTFGLGGVAADVLADQAARLAPLTDADADEIIRSIRSAPLLLGDRGVPPVDLAALREILLRVSRLADDVPEVAELDLSPVIARPAGASAVNARIRLAPAQPHDAFLRKLLLPAHEERSALAGVKARCEGKDSRYSGSAREGLAPHRGKKG